MNLAIIIGVSNYDDINYPTLKACDNDISIMKNTLEKLNKYEDICYISNSPKAHEVKQKITEFIKKHKAKTINELFFYFSGHGDRNRDDFFYVLSDFNESKRETTGLRNTELDGLIKNLSPKLTIKIIDACFSGTTYIKSNNDSIEPILKKSAEDNEFQNLYFFYSSNSEEESLANENISFFSESFFKSLLENHGDIRYRDIMAFVADDMNFNKYPEPIFITQANNTEIFGNITDELIAYLNMEFDINPENNELLFEQKDVKENKIQDKSLFELIQEKSENEYCTKEEGFNNIKLLKDCFSVKNWPEDITTIFKIEINELEDFIQNKKGIGKWLKENDDEKYFAIPVYEEEIYYQEEYVAIPTKPNALKSISAFNRLYGRNENDYKLEKVEKVRKILKGISFTTEVPFEGIQLKFIPKFNAIEHYCFTIVPIFSRKTLLIFNVIETLEYKGWESIINPSYKNWKVKRLSLKRKDKIVKFTEDKIVSITKYITDEIKTKLSK